MKKIIKILALAVIFAACNDRTKFILKGEIKNTGSEKKVLLFKVVNNGWKLVDSTILSENGKFKFTDESPEANLYKVYFSQNEYVFFAKNGDVLKLKNDLADSTHAYKVTGNDDNDKLMEFKTLKAKESVKINSIRAEIDRRVAANPDKRDDISNELMPIYLKEKSVLESKIVKFALDNPKSLAGFYAINWIDPMDNESSLIKYAKIIDPELKKNKLVADFVDKITKLISIQIGQTAPDFTINDLNGKPVSLKDFRGKYLLIDFWASWCAPCRKENPNVVKAYRKFKNKNFTILGISLDKDKTDWQKAIKQDSLTWNHVSELAGFEGPTVSLYQVEGIPSSFLIDPHGKIIARNLRDKELQKFLDKTL